MKASELREMPTTEILHRIDEMRKEMFNLKLAARADSLDNPQQIRGLRKDMARMLTVLRERDLAAAYVEAEAVEPAAALIDTNAVPAEAAPQTETGTEEVGNGE